MNAKRTYIVSVTRGGFKVSVAHNACWMSTSRIRQFTVDIFAKYFGGLVPSHLWHTDGDMASAGDRRGNNITVEQVNYFHKYHPGATTMRRPLCPMIIPKRKEAA